MYSKHNNIMRIALHVQLLLTAHFLLIPVEIQDEGTKCHNITILLINNLQFSLKCISVLLVKM